MKVFVVCCTNHDGNASVQVHATKPGALRYARERIENEFFEENKETGRLELFEGCGPDQESDIREALAAIDEGDYVSIDFAWYDCDLRSIWVDQQELMVP